MSGLKDVLSATQLVKHHELVLFLTQHANVRYTLAQLDYLLPRGASLQRFPEEWLELMRDGQCGNRNIEVIKPGEDDDDDDEQAPLAYQEALGGVSRIAHASLDAGVTLLCRRPEVRSLAELASLLETPASVPDAEGCVALHTSQIGLSTQLLRECQRRGLAYHFSEASQSTAAGGSAKAVRGSSAAPASGDSRKNEFLAAVASSPSSGAGVPAAVLRLPPGVRLRYQLLTRRGLMTSDEHCVPVRLAVGERLQVSLDDENAAARTHASLPPQSLPGTAAAELPTPDSSPRQRLRASCELRTPMLKRQEEMRENPPLRVRTRTESVPLPSSSSASLFFTKIQFAMEATRADELKLVFLVHSRHGESGDGQDGEAVQCVVDLEITDDDTRTPGVLIGREREPTSFTLPLSYQLADPAVLGTDTEPLLAEADGSAKPSSVLPWWLSSAPACRLVRDITYPVEETIQAAVRQIFTRQALTHESKMKAAKRLVQHQEERLAAAAAGARTQQTKRQTRQRASFSLRNRHLLFYGLDASVPPPSAK